MKLDKKYKVPEGFEPYYNYPNGQNEGVPVVGRAKLKISLNGLHRVLEFFIGENNEHIPSLPIKNHGEIWHVGWDIPTRWAIDNANECWVDNAHGSCLMKTTKEELLGSTDEDDVKERNKIKQTLGLELEEPIWMQTARKNGWTPPE